ncbi:MAG: substrate-binding domain-containing protein, partial [Chloroflexota bacterium]
EKGGKANVIILDYPRKDLQDRAQGLEDGLKEVAPDANVIGHYTGGTRDDGKKSVEKLIKDGVKFDFILSINDSGSYGAIDAMVEAGIDPSTVTIISIDAEELAKEYISKGYFIRASVESAREALADAMFDAMVLLLSGHDVPETINVPPKEIVTKETLAKAMTATAIIATPKP